MTNQSGCPCSASGRCTERRVRLGRLGLAVAMLGAFPVAHALTPLILRDAIPLCPFRILTGKPCPFCGVTRAIALATHARWREAFLMNPLWPAFAGTAVAVAVLLAIDAGTGRDLSGRFLRAAARRRAWIFSTLIAFGIWRIAYGSA